MCVVVPSLPRGPAEQSHMGAKAEMLLYVSGFMRPMVSAPWPPMLWPKMEVLVVSRAAKALSSFSSWGSSFVTYEYLYDPS